MLLRMVSGVRKIGEHLEVFSICSVNRFIIIRAFFTFFSFVNWEFEVKNITIASALKN